ncbi:MAG: peptidase U34 [Thermoprotei archaeon]|nr:MAG: peptidase U34 [Thermoprotei archaeon]
MCDTLVALNVATKNNIVLFGKNSDREPNEAQVLEYYPRIRHEEEMVKCTYIEVPQVKETYAVLISRPFWMWGAEMGVNEYGVAIGNEAVFTKEPYNKTGLTGMDMLRLALERSRNADEALRIIIDLLERYGQGGNCGYTHKMFYHNSFIIADPDKAWVLETAGKYWVVKRVEDVYSISNALTIGDEWDDIHPEAVNHAFEKGYCKGDFSFKECYSDWFYTMMSRGRERRSYTMKLLKEGFGNLDFKYFARILRSHYGGEGWEPSKGSMRDICMHAGGLTRPSQTANSYIGELRRRLAVHWFTATSIPCISTYKPVFIEAGLPNLGPKPTGRFDPRTLWWRHERLHRKILCSYRYTAVEIRKKIERLEEKILEKVNAIVEKSVREKVDVNQLLELTSWAFSEAEEILKESYKEAKKGICLNPFFAYFWWKTNKSAGVEVD